MDQHDICPETVEIHWDAQRRGVLSQIESILKNLFTGSRLAAAQNEHPSQYHVEIFPAAGPISGRIAYIKPIMNKRAMNFKFRKPVLEYLQGKMELQEAVQQKNMYCLQEIPFDQCIEICKMMRLHAEEIIEILR